MSTPSSDLPQREGQGSTVANSDSLPRKVLILGSGALKIGEGASSITPDRRRSRR